MKYRTIHDWEVLGFTLAPEVCDGLLATDRCRNCGMIRYLDHDTVEMTSTLRGLREALPTEEYAAAEQRIRVGMDVCHADSPVVYLKPEP